MVRDNVIFVARIDESYGSCGVIILHNTAWPTEMLTEIDPLGFLILEHKTEPC